MTKDRVVHVHIPKEFEGEIHLHVGSSGIQTASMPTGMDAAKMSDVEEMLLRFEKHTPATAARQVIEALDERGWRAYTPTTKKLGKSTASYIRLVYIGSHDEVVLYLNTVSVVYGKKKLAAKLVDHVDGAELHADGLMYLYHSEGRAPQAIEAMDALKAWADGELTLTSA